MHSPYTVCREILSLGHEITPLKLIKLAYISHGFHLGYLGKPIFEDKVEAWPYGPVIRSIYFSICHYRRKVIPHNTFNHIDDRLNDKSQKIIKAVINTYDKYDGLQLSTLTHKEDTPWDKTVREKGINEIISDSLIKDYYQEVIKNGIPRRSSSD